MSKLINFVLLQIIINFESQGWNTFPKKLGHVASRKKKKSKICLELIHDFITLAGLSNTPKSWWTKRKSFASRSWRHSERCWTKRTGFRSLWVVTPPFFWLTDGKPLLVMRWTFFFPLPKIVIHFALFLSVSNALLLPATLILFHVCEPRISLICMQWAFLSYIRIGGTWGHRLRGRVAGGRMRGDIWTSKSIPQWCVCGGHVWFWFRGGNNITWLREVTACECFCLGGKYSECTAKVRSLTTCMRFASRHGGSSSSQDMRLYFAVDTSLHHFYGYWCSLFRWLFFVFPVSLLYCTVCCMLLLWALVRELAYYRNLFD